MGNTLANKIGTLKTQNLGSTFVGQYPRQLDSKYSKLGDNSGVVSSDILNYQKSRNKNLKKLKNYNKNTKKSQEKINKYKLDIMQYENPSITYIKNKINNYNNISKKIEGFTSEEKPTQDSVTNQLLLKYDDKFNQNYNKTNILNKAIMSKDKMIYLTEVDSAKKDKLIGIMLYLLTLVIIIMFQVVISTTGIIKPKISVGICVVAIIIFLYKVYSDYIWSTSNYLTAMATATAKGMRNAAIVNVLPSDISKPYKCPAICKVNPDAPEEEINFNENPNRLRFLRTDSSRDVWRLGDQPENTFTTRDDRKPYGEDSDIPVYRETDEEIDYNKPKAWFDGINSSGATYYDCVWDGGDSKGIPANKQYNNTTIPCYYYPGFKEKRRRICMGDPNKDLSVDCNLINVSNA